MEKILIVEDDFIVRDNISSLLFEEGYHPITATNGLEALALIEKENPSIVLSDISMPKMNGFDLLTAIRNNKKTRLLPVILLTAKSERENFRNGMNRGADDYITKPFSPEEILASIESKLAKKNHHESVLKELKESILKNFPHEARTPLNPILGYTQLLEKEFTNLNKEEIVEMISEIKRSGMRLSGWIEKFILMTELLSDCTEKKNGDPVQCIVENNICNEFKNISKEWRDRHEDISIDLGKADVNILPSHLKFIIKELVENAGKFSKKGTPIFLHGKVEKGNYYITVTDFGSGFDINQISEIDLFNQFNRETIQQNGNGIGLSIINKLTEIYSGNGKVTSRQGKPTIVSVSLPLYKTKN